MHIEDAVQAVYELYRSFGEGRVPTGSIVNIAGEDTRVLRSFVEEIHELAGKRGKLEYGTFDQGKEGALSVCPDITRLKTFTGGWKERYSFGSGISEMMKKEQEQ
jgi:nucleoside-diphosphate-sugar epimerase